MINDKTTNQTSGDYSNNYNAQTINVTGTGLSENDVKIIVNDFFYSNFREFRKDALILVESRAKEFWEDFIKTLKPQLETLESFREPSMQNTFFNAQKTYALTGDKNISDVLIEMLVARTKEKNRSLRQIVFR